MKTQFLLHFRRLAQLVVLALALSQTGPGLADGTAEHQRLKFRNDFKSPEEVVGYYCGRDASGFVWSGLLDIERKAFTTWSEIPEQDTFYIAKKYQITVLPSSVAAKDVARVEVRYEITGMGDAHGTRMPSIEPELRVVFDLKRVGGAWKIMRPLPTEISPVVLESKFPSGSPSDSLARR